MLTVYAQEELVYSHPTFIPERLQTSSDGVLNPSSDTMPGSEGLHIIT